jgi:hypothetical protein
MHMGQDQALDLVDGEVDERGTLLSPAGSGVTPLKKTAVHEDARIGRDDKFVARARYAVLSAVVDISIGSPANNSKTISNR